jgi:hypothetical protein
VKKNDATCTPLALKRNIYWCSRDMGILHGSDR